MSENELLKAALEYAESGWAVFPCRLDKTPYVKWASEATTDEKTIKEWWLKWPKAGIAIVTGSKSKHLVIIDIDVKDGAADSFELGGAAAWPKGSYETRRVKTGGGGIHLYFKTPTVMIRNSIGKLAKGVDIRGEGGYIIAPPTIHASGKKYEWVDTTKPIMKISKEFSELIQAATDAKEERVIKDAVNSKDDIPKGERNGTLAKMAGFIHRMGYKDEEVLDKIADINEERCKPPLEYQEVQKLVKSMCKYSLVFALSDVGNAERLIRKERGNLKYCAEWNCWLAYDGKRWSKTIGKSKVMNAAITITKEMQNKKFTEEEIFEGEDFSLKDLMDNTKLNDHGIKSQNLYRLEAMVKIAAHMKGFICTIDDFDQDIYKLNCQNGTVDLRTGILHEHDPEDNISKITNTEYPAKVGQKAEFTDKDILLWLECLNTWMEGSQSQIRYLQRFAGYCLSGVVTGQFFPIFYGGGANGKSSFLDCLRHMMGVYATKAPESLLKQESGWSRHPTEIADLAGRRLVVASETKGRMKLKTSIIKEMTGDGTMKGRFMAKDFFEFKVTHKLVLMTNELPDIEEDTEAIWRRINLVGWNYQLPENKWDRNLQDKFERLWPYILAWAVKGFDHFFNIHKGKWKRTKAIKEATKQYRGKEDIIETFIDEECIVSKDIRKPIPFKMLYNAFREYAKKNNREPSTQTKFGRVLEEKGFVAKTMKIDGKSTRCRLGLILDNEQY